MNLKRLRFWLLGVKITIPLVGITWAFMYDWATATQHDPSASNWLVVLIGFCILAVSIFGMDKLYQKYKDRV